MAILQAKFILSDKSNSEILIKPSEIKDRNEYVEKFKNHLFCSENNCDAKLDFVQVDFPVHKTYFRTHPHSKHSDNCPNLFENIANGNSKYGNSLYAALDNEAKKQILIGTYKKATQENSKTSSDNPQKKRKSSVVNKNKISDEYIRFVPTTDPNAEPLPNGKKRPPVMKRSCEGLSDNDIGKTRVVYGKITSVDIGNNYININTMTEKNGKVSFEFYSPFQNNSKNEYYKLRNYKNCTDMYGDLVTAISIVEKRNEQYFLPVMDAASIAINKKYLLKYFYDKY